MSRKLRLRLGFDDNARGSVLPAKIAMAHFKDGFCFDFLLSAALCTLSLKTIFSQ
jgi:hypothetical protein